MGRPKSNLPEFTERKCIVCDTPFKQPRRKSQRKTCSDECYAATRPKFDMRLKDYRKMRQERREYNRSHYEVPIRNLIEV